MYKIFTPQSNSNDEFVFIAEWKFKNNEFVKKGDHLLSVETSNLVARTFKSVTFLNAAAVVIPVIGSPNELRPTTGNPPLHTPVTVATPTTETEFEVTLTTLVKIGSSDISRSLY